MEEIVMTINGRTGDYKVETSGFKGDACRTATSDIERRLGATVDDETLKSEFHERPVENRIKMGTGRG